MDESRRWRAWRLPLLEEEAAHVFSPTLHPLRPNDDRGTAALHPLALALVSRIVFECECARSCG
jgi:hypothetical protein